MRFIVILSVLVPIAAAQAPQYDLVLKGGHVIDAKNHVDALRDVAIKDGRIARVGPPIDAAVGRKVVDVSGLYVAQPVRGETGKRAQGDERDRTRRMTGW